MTQERPFYIGICYKLRRLVPQNLDLYVKNTVRVRNLEQLVQIFLLFWNIFILTECRQLEVVRQIFLFFHNVENIGVFRQ
jgi:hypothetical protein